MQDHCTSPSSPQVQIIFDSGLNLKSSLLPYLKLIPNESVCCYIQLDRMRLNKYASVRLSFYHALLNCDSGRLPPGYFIVVSTVSLAKWQGKTWSGRLVNKLLLIGHSMRQQSLIAEADAADFFKLITSFGKISHRSLFLSCKQARTKEILGKPRGSVVPGHGEMESPPSWLYVSSFFSALFLSFTSA